MRERMVRFLIRCAADFSARFLADLVFAMVIPFASI
jgi:hypothetical protein